MIPVRFRSEKGTYVHSMYLDNEAPISGGREIWGFPQKLARPKLCHECARGFWSEVQQGL
jgi:acetoacetate decarboxylase